MEQGGGERAKELRIMLVSLWLVYISRLPQNSLAHLRPELPGDGGDSTGVLVLRREAGTGDIQRTAQSEEGAKTNLVE